MAVVSRRRFRASVPQYRHIGAFQPNGMNLLGIQHSNQAASKRYHWKIEVKNLLSVLTKQNPGCGPHLSGIVIAQTDLRLVTDGAIKVTSCREVFAKKFPLEKESKKEPGYDLAY